MKKYSMLVGAILLGLLNIYGLAISSIFTPPSLALIAIVILSLCLVTTT
jgi:hypothetical protein